MSVCFWCSTEVMVKVHVVDLKNENIAAPVSVRAYLNQTITEFKQLIAQVILLIHLLPLLLPLRFCTLYLNTVWDLRFKCLSLQATGLPAETMRVVLERCYNDLRLLYVPNKTLKAEGFFRSNKVFLFWNERVFIWFCVKKKKVS